MLTIKKQTSPRGRFVFCPCVYKPNSVIKFAFAKLSNGYLSGIHIAMNLKRPYGLAPNRCLHRLSSLTVPRELLPHDFTLASPVKEVSGMFLLRSLKRCRLRDTLSCDKTFRGLGKKFLSREAKSFLAPRRC